MRALPCLLLGASAAPAFAHPAASSAARDQRLSASPGQTDALLKARIRPEGLQASYQLWIAVPCPPPQECIEDDLVGKGLIAASTKVASVRQSADTMLDEVGLQPATT